MKALRRLAEPMVAPRAGAPLIKSVPSLGWMLVERKGTSTVPDDMPEELRKRHVYRDFLIFCEWMRKEDGAEYVEGTVRVEGPFPHFEPKEPDTQYGDNGAHRKVGRSIVADTSNTGKEDYKILAVFRVRERMQEIPTELALDLFDKGRPGLRPLRGREWRNTGVDKWLPRT